ncbi:hypothetical protein [Photobacterium leiognathi]|uniref:hypothetical protein n=1 Tax=Photobacterium leiognathi TaxID=553611 RepID=UPI003DA0736E
MANKKRKKNVPLELLTPTNILPAILEPELQELYKLACQNSESVWPKIKIEDGQKPSKDIIDEFIDLTHQGMRIAQKKMIKKLLLPIENDDISHARLFAYRGIADAIGWQLFNNELGYVKQFFMAQQPPTLREANIESVLSVVQQCHEQDSDSIALISDLTTFIQVGDIYHVKKDGSTTIYEVKEGKTNKQILDILKGMPTLIADSDVPNQFADKPVNFQKQVQRIIRQKQRMKSLQETLLNDEGVDTSTGLSVKILDLPAEIGTWYSSIVDLSKQCELKGYAIDVIQDCLYIGCYETGRYKVPGQLAFEGWFTGIGATPDCPRTSLVNCMMDPLGLPIYNLPIPDELKFDLLFGRKHISLGIHMQKLIEICIDIGISIRLADKKETARIKQKNKYLWSYNGQAIVFGEGLDQSYLGEGFALRVFFHGEKPVDTMLALTTKKT